MSIASVFLLSCHLDLWR